MVIPREGPNPPPEEKIAFLDESAVKTSIIRPSEESLVNALRSEPSLQLAMCSSRGGQLFS